MGKGGVGLIVLLVAALLAAMLLSTQLNSAHMAPSEGEQAAVEQAQDAVDSVNDALSERLEQYDDLG